MKNDLRYAASDCFETFPFPKPDPRTTIPALEDVGQRLYDMRANYMVSIVHEEVGLTKTYNRLKDPACDDARILELRKSKEGQRELIKKMKEADPSLNGNVTQVLDQVDTNIDQLKNPSVQGILPRNYFGFLEGIQFRF